MSEMHVSHITDLTKLREPFPQSQINTIPRKGMGGRIVELSYVGHAALTNRLLDTDPGWTWEPLAMSPDGLPVMDNLGGMWIKLTVCGVTRLGYGHAGDKTGGDAIKEVIGDALRNAAMRFGAALDLWHKGDEPLYEEPDHRISAPKESAKASAEVIDDARKAELEEMAISAINLFKANRNSDMMELVHEVTDNEEKIFFWNLLATESKMRSFIKAQAVLSMLG